jgi:hypothetical protein
MWIAHHEKQILDMNEADRVIEVVAAQRETGVLRLDRLFYICFEIILHIQVNDVAARCHDIAHDAVPQIQHVEYKFTAESRYLC